MKSSYFIIPFLFLLILPLSTAFSWSDDFSTDTTSQYGLKLNYTYNSAGNVTLEALGSTSAFLLVNNVSYVSGTNISSEFTYVYGSGAIDSWVGLCVECNQSGLRLSGFSYGWRHNGGTYYESIVNNLVALMIDNVISPSPAGKRWRSVMASNTANNTFYMKIWPYDIPEPVGWNITLFYATGPSIAGSAWGVGIPSGSARMDVHFLGYNTTSWAPPLIPYLDVQIQDIYNSSNVENLLVTLADGTSNTTGSDGVAHFENATTQSFNVTDPLYRYFAYNSTSNPVENATTTYNISGAFITLNAYNLLNNSVGSFNASSGLQSNSTTTTDLLLYLPPNATTSVLINGSGYYPEIPFSITTTGQDSNTYNLTGLYESLMNITALYSGNGSAINNFSINYTGVTTGVNSTTTGEVLIPAMFGNYTFIIDAAGYTLENVTLNLTSNDESYIFNLSITNSVNISFYDEETGVLLNSTTVYLELISTSQSGNYSTTTGSIYEDLLLPDSYILRYNALGYENSFYYLTLVDRTFNALNLTLLNSTSSTEVTITTYDTIGNILEGAFVKVLKYDISANTYTIVEILESNFQGQSKANILLNTEYYVFVIDYEGVTRYTTNPTYVYGTTLSFYVPLENTGMEDFFSAANIEGTITYNYASQIATFTYNDLENTATQGCLYAYSYNPTGNTLINSSCGSASTGVLSLPAFNTTTKWYFLGKVTKGGTENEISSYRVDFVTQIEDDGSGALYAFFALAVIVFIGVYSLELAVILAGLTPLLFSIMHLAKLEYVVTLPLFIGSIILAAILGAFKK